MVVSALFFRNGSTSATTIFISVEDRRYFNRSSNSSLLNSNPLNCLVRSCRCMKSSGIPFLTYHSKSYQSRPFTLCFQLRNSKACILPANKSDKVKQRTIKEKGCNNRRSSVLNFIGGLASTSILILMLFSV